VPGGEGSAGVRFPRLEPWARNGQKKKHSKKEIVDGRNLSLDEWLLQLRNDKITIVPNWCFPSEQLLKLYCDSIHDRSSNDVKWLIRKFLITTCVLGDSTSRLDAAIRNSPKFNEGIYNSELDRRSIEELFRAAVWEGVTWALDLLPNHPVEAVSVVNNYLKAHISALPDGRISGLADAAQLIAAKYQSMPSTNAPALSYFEQYSWRDFEELCCYLYNRMGYMATLTPPSKDGGRDVIAARKQLGQSEILYIECKLYNGKVGEEVVKKLHSTVIDERANRGAVITTGAFTKPAITFARRNNIELIHGDDLVKMLATHFGTEWHLQTKYLRSISKARLEADRQSNTS
jgi:restriction system protein